MAEIPMDDLWVNGAAHFTRWVTEGRRLQEPFVVVDVGVQGGANDRWKLLGDHLILHGFDAIAEVIDGLQRVHAGRAGCHFHNCAIGDTDGEVTFYFNAANPTASSMYAQEAGRFDGQLREQVRTVPMRRLDTLFADAAIPRADFLKVDVEGFEKAVFLGARNLMAAGLLGIETEANFRVSQQYPRSHFTAISDIVVEHGFTVYDLAFNRIPRASFTRVLRRNGVEDLAQYDLGGPATFNFLFCRSLIDERDSPQIDLGPPPAPGIDRIIKAMVVWELYGLNDVAVDTAECFRETLAPRFDVDQAIRLLASPECRPPSGLLRLQEMFKVLQDMRQSTSWRITAPLRATKDFLTGRRQSAKRLDADEAAG
jgi:FkbM family methyltransferase